MASHGPGGTQLPPQMAVIVPQHYHPPTPRELRAQAVHRLQIGVLGLASMLLLVGLANIIMDRARADGAGTLATTASASPTAIPVSRGAGPGNDPLADLGVVPDLPAGAAPAPVQPSPPAPTPRPAR